MLRPLVASVAVLALMCPAADAQVKPFLVTGGGPVPDGLSVAGADSPHSATGVATHLGKYAGDGVARVQTLDLMSLTGTFKGEFVFAAANGDKLACTYGDTANGAAEVGKFQLFPVGNTGKVVAVFVAEFNPDTAKCTGKFKDVVDGSFLMIAVTEPFPLVIDPETGFSPPFNYAWTGAGWLEFRKKK